MAANEAPKKIYFNKHTAQYNHERRNNDDIEYIRTDVFIDKACEYLRTKKKCVFACIGEDLYLSLLNKKEIENFKNYMKEE